MTILELAANIDKSSQNEDEYFIYHGILDREFQIYEHIQSKDNTRLKSYWLLKWYCTDTYVGRKLYFFDDKFVAMSYQSGRKQDENFYWISNEAFKEVRDYMLSLVEHEELTPENLLIDEDLQEEFDKERIL